MARGWESKSVESQMESAAELRKARAAVPQLTPEQAKRQSERESLQLSRKRVLHDLQAATNPRYRDQLEAALRHLDEKLSALE
jgi:hypothetical protein